MEQKLFLDADPSILETKLKIVKNDLEQDFKNVMDAQKSEIKNKSSSQQVIPYSGICIKSFKVNTNEKFFINLCHTKAIPAPEDINEAELHEILHSETPSSFRIPMSISEIRPTNDKSGNQADVCDIAINSNFFYKCLNSVLFRDFLVALILEALSEKYNVQIKSDNWIVLKNRKYIDKLVVHRIHKRDVQAVYDSHNSNSKRHSEATNVLPTDAGNKLIEEIHYSEANRLMKSNVSKDPTIPQHRLTGKMEESKVVELFAEFFLPKCITASDISLDVGEDRILIDANKQGYHFDRYIDYKVDQDKVTAKFDVNNASRSYADSYLNNYNNNNINENDQHKTYLIYNYKEISTYADLKNSLLKL